MSTRAWAYIWSVLLAGAVQSACTLVGLGQTTNSQWPLFILCVVLATVAQLFKAEAPNHMLFYASPVFFFAGAMLLPPFLLVLLVIIPHLVEWAKERWRHSTHLRAWYLQPFNIAVYSIAGLSAQWVGRGIAGHLLPNVPLSSVLTIIAAAIIFVAVNHILIGFALVLARGVSWQASGVLAIESLMSDLIMLLLGGVVAMLWQVNPWAIVLALSPLVLMYRALMIPQLQQEAWTDAKTGLYNARHFNALFTAELERAGRFHRPMAVVMADLDLMRNINNTYGHLAGDIVLAGIGKCIRATVREFDIAGRFGGEEFAVLLLEVEAADSRLVAERIRQAVENIPFVVPTSPTPIHVTMSIGVATFPQDGTTLTELTHAADVAVYQAKAQGRNRVICAVDVLSSTLGPEHESDTASSESDQQDTTHLVAADTTLVPSEGLVPAAAGASR